MPVVIEEEGKRKQIDLRDAPALARFRGRDLEGVLYDRLFTFFEPDVPGRVVLGDYVTATDGTGLVHTAPPFGEDDYQTGRRYGLPMIFSVDGEGKMVPGDRPVRRPLVQGRRSQDHPGPEEPRPDAPQRPLSPQLSLLLALRPAAPLLRHHELVHPHHRR